MTKFLSVLKLHTGQEFCHKIKPPLKKIIKNIIHTQNCIMISHSSGIVSTENMIDQMSSPIGNLVASPFMRTVADKNNTKYMMLRMIDV